MVAEHLGPFFRTMQQQGKAVRAPGPPDDRTNVRPARNRKLSGSQIADKLPVRYLGR